MKENKIHLEYILICLISFGAILFVILSLGNKFEDKVVSGDIPAICSFKCINLNMTYFAENAQKDFCLCLKDNSTIYPIQRSGALQ